MRNVSSGILTMALSMMAVPVMAECPANLTVEQKIDCIVVENAGYFYPLPATQASIQAPLPGAEKQQQSVSNANQGSQTGK